MINLTAYANMWPILTLILVWTLPWKGYALYQAAKRGDIKWFIAILILNTLAILDIIYLGFVVKAFRKKEGK